MSISLSLDLGKARASCRVLRDPHDVERLHLRFDPPLGRRAVGLGLGGWAGVAVLEALRRDWDVLAAALPFACFACLIAFARSTLVLDRRRGRIETVWAAPLPFVRFLEVQGPFGEVVLSQVEETWTARDTTHRETTYPVVVTAGGHKAPLRSLATWEEARDLAEAVARFLRVGLRDEVEARTLGADQLDQPLARSAAGAVPAGKRRGPIPIERWNGEDELVVEIPRPGRSVARHFLGLLAIVGVLWTPLALLGGGLVAGLLPLVLIAAAGLKLSWGYGARVVANARGLTVEPAGLVRRRRVEIPLAELESLLLLRPEQGGARGLLTEFFDGVLVARSDRASVRFGHGLDRAALERIRHHLTQLFVRLGRSQGLATPPAEPAAPADRLAPVLVAWLLCAVAALRLGPPASVCLNLPILSVGLSALALSGALVARWLTRRGPAAGWTPRRTAVALVAAAAGLWLGFDLFPGWVAATPDWDLRAFWSVVTARPGPAAGDSWLLGLTPQQAVTFFAGVLGFGLLASWVLAVLLVPLGMALARRFRKRHATLLPLLPPSSPRVERPAAPLLAPPSARRRHAPALVATLALLWSAALFPDAWRPLSQRQARIQEREARESAARQLERRSAELASRTLLRLEMPPPGTRLFGRPGLWFFAEYEGPGSALVEHLMWLRRAYAHADLRVVGFPRDVHGASLAALLDQHGWRGDHAADASEAAEYRSWAGFARPGAYALLLEADGTVRDRLALPWDVEPRLEAWLGPPAIPRPARVPVAVELRWTYAGHPAEMPAEGWVTVQAYDAWKHAHAPWLHRRGPLPRERVEIQAQSGTWRANLQATALSGGRWTPAWFGSTLALLPAAAGSRAVVEIPLQVPIWITAPPPEGDGFPEWPAYPASQPLVLAWTEAPEADRYTVRIARLSAPETEEPRLETLPGSRSSLTLAGLPPGRYEVTLEALRGDLRLGFLETRQGGTTAHAFRFVLEPFPH